MKSIWSIECWVGNSVSCRIEVHCKWNVHSHALMNGHLHIAVILFVVEEFLVKFERIPNIISYEYTTHDYKWLVKAIMPAKGLLWMSLILRNYFANVYGGCQQIKKYLFTWQLSLTKPHELESHGFYITGHFLLYLSFLY